MGIKPGQPREPAPAPMTLVRDGARVAAVPEVELPPLTAETVRDTLDHVRR
jgi:hypothetical protein